jgi:leucyl aminopeptidase
MLGMHQDMTGSAVALAMTLLAARLKLPGTFDTYLALAENHISNEGFKMNDVVKASNGKTIEIIHTDAEGRMVLSDTLALATESKPDLVFDYATLTGSCIRAIGTNRAGVYSNQMSKLPQALKAAEASGEDVWIFPVGAEYEKRLESKVADLRQCDDAPNADHIIAATFLNHFVARESLWFHMDLSTNDEKAVGWLPEEGSGFGLRWTLAMLGA